MNHTILGKHAVTGGLFKLGVQARCRHIYLIGGTGVGKSTLLRNIAAQDMAGGDGLLLLDPHGDLAEDVLQSAPPWRANQTCYLNLPDLAHPVGLNVLEETSADERAVAADGVVSAMRAMWPDSWGPRMEHILRHAVMALIETPNTSLIMLPRLLTDADYRAVVTGRLSDPFVRRFFAEEFERYGDRFREEAIAPILNKVGAFLASPAIRNVLGQGRSSLDLVHAMQRGRIVIVNLAKGLVGETAAHLMGALLIARLKTAAMARARLPAGERRPFHLIVDEAQNFSTAAFASLLPEARKYALTVTAANQHLAQLSDDLRTAILGNAGTLMVFRVGAEDASLLAREFDINPHALQELALAQAWGRRSGSPQTYPLELFPPPQDNGRADIIKKQSRRHYGRSREAVEGKISKALGR